MEKRNKNLIPSDKMRKLMKCLGKSCMATKTWQVEFNSYLPITHLL